MKESTIEIRDRRERGYFTIDNEIIDNYPDLTAYGLVVYMVLCRISNNETQRCRVSLNVLADKCKISRSSVQRALENLAVHELIFVETLFDSSNVYMLLSVDKVVDDRDTPRSHRPPPPGHTDLPPVPTDLLNKTINKTKTTTPPDGEGFESSKDKDRVRRVFAYYLEKFGRRPAMYELTPKRLKVGLARLADCRRKCGGDIEKAEQLMGVVVDALAESEFHNGKNDSKRRYVDWIDHLFKSTEKLEWWLERLDAE